MKPELIIRILTISSLAGLLLAVGLRLKFEQLAESVKRSRFLPILLVNFAVVPLLCGLTAKWAGLDPDTATAMVLLGAAPFAPVVPVFARMARADLALAAGLTSIYPVISSFLTPWVCGLVLKPTAGPSKFQFASGQVMLVLVATITVPLLLGVALNHVVPRLAQWGLRRIEVLSEATGAVSLAFVTIVEFSSILAISSKALLAMGITFEVSLLAGYWLGHDKGSRRVIALGTSNRNIALALLVALQSFPNSHVLSGVVGNGLLLIALGLAHVGFWNLQDRQLLRRAP
jgi:bile acid:Na+ symporter, BASS family